MKMRLLKTVEDLDSDAIVVTLFKCERDVVCGWYVGPIRLLKSGVSVPYLAPSRRVLGQVAVVRASQVANSYNLPVCIVDPESLWSSLWQTGPVR